MNCDLIIHNIGQLVTCAFGGSPKRGDAMCDVGIIGNGAVAITGGKFAAVGPSNEITGAYDASRSIDAGGRVVCPGFVDPHTHIVFAGDRLDEFELKIRGADYLEILENGGGIISTVRHTRAAPIEDLVAQSRIRLDRMLACGTTSVEIKTGYGLDTETEIKMLQAIEVLDRTHPVDIIPTFLAAHAVPPEFKGDADGYVELVCKEMLPLAWSWYEASHFPGDGKPFFIDVFCEKNAFDLEQSRRIIDAAASFGFAVKAHVDEFTNLGGSTLGIRSKAVSIDHLDAISDNEIAELAASRTVGVVTPTVNFNFGSSDFADARRLIDAGCAVALSTDYNPGSAPCPSQPLAMAIACRYQKLLPSEALNAVTANAAAACGISETHGSIEAGKAADLVLADTNDYRELPHLIGGNLVRAVIKNGTVAHGNA